jgi:hypothetical protein
VWWPGGVVLAYISEDPFGVVLEDFFDDLFEVRLEEDVLPLNGDPDGGLSVGS